tara:strand:- start:2793 stop:3212 length:420 start_codon:yes stop_codon:yes gene_type:complete
MDTYLKNVVKSNWDFILELRNSDYRYFYEQNEPISKVEHYKYMEKQSKIANFHHWIISQNDIDVGYVRILDDDVGIMIKKEFQSKGIASKALLLLENEAKQIGINKLIALVHPNNIGSERIFKKNGYDLKMLRLEKSLN